MIEVSAEAIERVERILAGVPNGAERALSNAINRGLSRIKTGAKKRVKEVYTVQSSAFTASANTQVNKASTSNLAGVVTFAGCKIPLYKFQVTPKAPGVGRKVRAAVRKGGGTQFEEAFIANLKYGTGVFERETSKRFPVQELMGLSAAQMVENEHILQELAEEAQEVVNERIEHEIERILNGYGG